MNEKDGKILFLDEATCQELLTNQDALRITDRVLKEFAAGDVVNPVKLHLPVYPDVDGYINSMPTYHKKTKECGMKFVSVYHNNPRDFGMLATMGTIILNDWETGMPYAIVGGTHVTNARTGAAAALKVKYFARKNSKIITIVGAGAQGFSALQMTLTAVGEDFFEEVHVSDINIDRVNSYIEKAKAKYPKLKFAAFTDNSAAVHGADVALFCAAAPVPLLEKCEITDGLLVVIVNEIVTRKAVAQFDTFFTDFTDCVMERFNVGGRNAAKAGGFVYEDLTPDLVTCQVGEAMSGAKPGRVSDTQKILTMDVGMGIEDVACARFCYEQALKLGKGTILDFQNLKL